MMRVGGHLTLSLHSPNEPGELSQSHDDIKHRRSYYYHLFKFYFIFYCVLVRVTVYYVGCLSGVINNVDDDDNDDDDYYYYYYAL